MVWRCFCGFDDLVFKNDFSNSIQNKKKFQTYPFLTIISLFFIYFPIAQTARRFYWLRLCYFVYLIGYRIALVDCTSSSYSSISNNVKLSAESIRNRYFKVKPTDAYVIEGDNTEFKCQINPDTDAGPVQWAKDGFLLGKCGWF